LTQLSRPDGALPVYKILPHACAELFSEADQKYAPEPRLLNEPLRAKPAGKAEKPLVLVPSHEGVLLLVTFILLPGPTPAVVLPRHPIVV
jgi:hypothetical protein